MSKLKQVTSKKSLTGIKTRGRVADIAAPADLKLTDEQTKWQKLNSTATAAFDFWSSFLDLRMGASDKDPLSADAINNFRAIIRAVSWVESKHGTAGANFPDRDPMQCGHPADAWWKVLTEKTPKKERFVGGPNAKNYWGEELPGAAAGDAAFPALAKLASLSNKDNGHRDAKFNSMMSFYWAVPFLIQKINAQSGKTYKCGDASKARMIDGAVAYNGGGDPNYRKKINEAWDLIIGAKARTEQSIELDLVEVQADRDRATLDEKWLKIALEITGDFETSGNPWSSITGDFDGQGISCGVLQWNIGQGSLQPLVKDVGQSVVLKYMPTHGDELWAACIKPISERLVIVRGWQSGGSIKSDVLLELEALFGSGEMIKQQIARAGGLGQRAMNLAQQWAKVERASNSPTLREFCWFFDLLTLNGSLKGLWYQDAQEFIAGHAPNKADDAICDWLASLPSSIYGRKDAKKNSALWRDHVEAEHLYLFVLGYLRSQKSRAEFRAVVMNRRGTIAVTKGWVNGELEDLKILRSAKAGRRGA